MKHFSTEEWIDFVNDAIADSAKQQMHSHLATCRQCKRAVSLWQKVRATAASAGIYEPPQPAVHLAKAAFASAQFGRRRENSRSFVEVLFDSFQQPLTAGARSSVSGIRQMLYRSEPYQVDLQIEAKPGANKLIVTGQLLDLRNPDRPGRDVPVMISNLRGHVVQTVTNEFGEFREEIRSSGDLELKLLGEDEKVVIISLRDALGKPSHGVN
jgi:hypothetical protein